MTKNMITTDTKFRVVHTKGNTWIPLYRNPGEDWRTFEGTRLLSYYAWQASAVRVICARAKVAQPRIDFYDRNVETPVEWALEHYRDLSAKERELYGWDIEALEHGSYNQQRAFHRVRLHTLTRYLGDPTAPAAETEECFELRRASVIWLRDHA